MFSRYTQPVTAAVVDYAAPNYILWFLERYFCAVFRAFGAIDKGLKEILNIYAVFS